MEGTKVRQVQKELVTVWDREIEWQGQGAEASLTTSCALCLS